MIYLLLFALLFPAYGHAASIGGGGTAAASSATGWPQTDAGDVTFADSLGNGVCIGAGNPLCAYEDSTLGALIRPQTDANTRTYIWTNKTWSMFDVEGNKDMVIADPDAIGAGSGTITMQTSEQFVGSNLGIEFTESDTNPTCSSGNYNIYADTSEATLKYCNNGTAIPFSPEIFVRKTASETVNNSTTLQDDDALVIPVAASSTYAIKLFVLYDSSTTADFKYVFTLPASATGWKSTTSAGTGTTTCSGTSGAFIYNDITQTNNNVGGAGTGTANTCAIVIEGVIVTAGTAGNVVFQWAQATGDATDTVVRANSWLSYRRIP